MKPTTEEDIQEINELLETILSDTKDHCNYLIIKESDYDAIKFKTSFKIRYAIMIFFKKRMIKKKADRLINNFTLEGYDASKLISSIKRYIDLVSITNYNSVFAYNYFNDGEHNYQLEYAGESKKVVYNNIKVSFINDKFEELILLSKYSHRRWIYSTEKSADELHYKTKLFIALMDDLNEFMKLR